MNAKSTSCASVISAAAAVSLLLGMEPAQAAVFGPYQFNVFNNNNGDFTGTLDITTNGTIDFKVTNTTAGLNSKVFIVAFEQTLGDYLLDSPTPVIVNGTGVNFVADGSPNLPGSNTINWSGVSYGFKSSTGSNPSVINPQELATFKFAFDLVGEAGTFANVAGLVDYIVSNGFVGVHVGECDELGGSCSAVVPIPAALPLMLSALGGLGLLGWWRREHSVAA